MNLIIDKKNTRAIRKILREKLKGSPQGGNLSAHYGKLKRGLDGLEYQLVIRENED